MVALGNLTQIWYWGTEGGGHLQYKNDSNFEKGARSYIWVKIMFCFFL